MGVGEFKAVLLSPSHAQSVPGNIARPLFSKSLRCSNTLPGLSAPDMETLKSHLVVSDGQGERENI